MRAGQPEIYNVGVNSVISFIAAFSIATVFLIPCARAEEKKPESARPVITHSPALDSLEELVWASRDKLERWCLKCMRFSGWRNRVEYLRKRLAESSVNSEIWRARGELLDEIRENTFENYITDVEGRSTEIVQYKKISSRTSLDGERTLEFRITERDELKNGEKTGYELRAVRYDAATRRWITVSTKKRERSLLQADAEELKNNIIKKNRESVVPQYKPPSVH